MSEVQFSKSVCLLDNCEVQFLEGEIVFKEHTKEIHIKAENFDRFQKLIKLSCTLEDTKGKVYQLSRSCLCLFKEKHIFFCEDKFHIKIEYSKLRNLCQIICDSCLLTVSKVDGFELILLRNYLSVFFCLSQPDRKSVLTAFEQDQSHLISHIIKVILKSSDLQSSNEYFQFELRRILKDNLKLLKLIMYAKKVTETL